jgi:hypothetical protein
MSNRGGSPTTSSRQSSAARDRPKDREKEPVLIDNAFLKACQNVGIAPEDLRQKSLEEFRVKGVPDKVAERRFSNFQNARVRKLHLIVAERSKLLNDYPAVAVEDPVEPESHQEHAEDQQQQSNRDRAVRSRERSPSNKSKSSSGGGHSSQRGRRQQGPLKPRPPEASQSANAAAEQDLMVQRALRQRQFWDTVNERVQKSQEEVEKQRQQEILQSREYAEQVRKKREEEEEKRQKKHKENQERLRQRWERDDEQARLRQERIDAEFSHRMQVAEAHAREIQTARERREQSLASKAHEGTDVDTETRLRMAKELRESVEAKKRESGYESLEKVEERRKHQVFQRFLIQAQLSERALKEREHTKKVLERNQQNLGSKTQRAMEKIDSEEARGEKVLSEQQKQRLEHIGELAAGRDKKHQKAKEKKTVENQTAEEKRQALEMQRAEERRKREERKALDEAIAKADAEARDEYHRFVLNRVAKVTEAQQEENLRIFERNQRRAEERIRRLNEIRSLLNH